MSLSADDWTDLRLEFKAGLAATDALRISLDQKTSKLHDRVNETQAQTAKVASKIDLLASKTDALVSVVRDHINANGAMPMCPNLTRHVETKHSFKAWAGLVIRIGKVIVAGGAIGGVVAWFLM